MNNFLGEEKNEIKEILRRIRKKDFSGNSGQAIKNSVYQFSTSFISKLGSLIFTIILARLLLPELFGLYSLALSVILMFAVFSELGISSALIKFVSSELGKGNEKTASAYLNYFMKIKLFFIFISTIILGTFANFVANTIYQKPIFLALFAGIFYILFIELTGFLESTFQASNNFRKIFYKEILLQVLRITFVSVAVILSLKYLLSQEITLMMIIVGLSLALFFSFFFLLFNLKRKKYSDKLKLSKEQKQQIKKFLIFTSVIALSGVFFSYIDKIMLGYFLDAEFVGYYSAAVSFIGALSPLVGFASIVLLPIFTKLKGKQLSSGLKKSVKLTILISFIIFLATILFAYFIILIIYGEEYLPSVNILQLLSPLIFTIPLIALYSSYFLSQDKPQIVSKLLILSTLVNIILNYILISNLLLYGQIYAVYGAAIATIISQVVYLFGLILGRKN
ncbi:flippase [Candidatus Pacearchaeota archaeon]|jgi:O-antigen/teichoic acid export membrane protein|nr:flippase [Candidatus Pacearchaeota archaeon]